ncbi:MAG: hypothetical protein WC615_11615 [Mucilaginibacter sp.]|uniref:hypothetical protein n=1 Tax=Mucilaginibacter sp. TaxID=1882438 RepID=UPI0035670C79
MAQYLSPYYLKRPKQGRKGAEKVAFYDVISAPFFCPFSKKTEQKRKNINYCKMATYAINNEVKL